MLGVFPALLRDLRDFRVQAKGLARKARDPALQGTYDALQATFKILINSFYGYLGFSLGHFNDFTQADCVTSTGREIIQQIVTWLGERRLPHHRSGHHGLDFTPPPGGLRRWRDGGTPARRRVARAYPAGISLELDGRYPAMFSYKMKNYALLDERGEVILEGLRAESLAVWNRICAPGWRRCSLLLLQGGGATRSTRCWPSTWRSLNSISSM